METNIGNFTASVNGYLTAFPPLLTDGRITGMLDDVLHRVHERLAALKLSETAASEKAGLSKDAIRNMRRAIEKSGREGVSTKTILALAPVLETTAGWLLDGGEAPIARVIPITGRIGAANDGEIIQATGDENYGLVKAPFTAEPYTRAAEVAGTSMGEMADGSIVFYSMQHPTPLPDMLGYPVIVCLEDGRILLKRLLRGSSPKLFDLQSINGPMMPDQRVEWFAHIDYIIPPWRARQLRVPDSAEARLLQRRPG